MQPTQGRSLRLLFYGGWGREEGTVVRKRGCGGGPEGMRTIEEGGVNHKLSSTEKREKTKRME